MRVVAIDTNQLYIKLQGQSDKTPKKLKTSTFDKLKQSTRYKRNQVKGESDC